MQKINGNKLGSVNPCGWATVFDAKGIPVASCLDTPNSIAAAFKLHPNAVRVQGDWVMNTAGTREQYERRMIGLDMEYHKQFIRTL